MTAMWIVALTVGSAFLHALWNALLRVEPDKDAAITAVMTMSGLIGAAVAIVQVALGTPPLPTWTAAAWGALSGVAEGIYFVALARGLTLGPLGPVYTVSRGGAVALVWPLSVWLLGEHATALALLGTGLVIAGLIASGAERGAPRAALAWAVLAAVCIAGYHLSYKAALGAGASPAGVFTISMAVAAGGSALGRARRGLPVWPPARRGRFAMIGAVCAASFLLFLVALAHSGAGHVFTLRNTSVLFATALGWIVGDRPGGRQIAGALLVAVGAVLLGLGG